jgi:hypothetical protein
VPSVVEQPEGQQPEQQPTELRPEAVDEVLRHLRAAQEGVRSVGDILRDALAADDALIAEATSGPADGVGATTGSAGGGGATTGSVEGVGATSGSAGGAGAASGSVGGVGATGAAEVAGDGFDASGQAR